MTTLSRHLFIEGRVQGVGFRWALRQEALRLGVDGWVRNLYDGRVEAYLSGECEAVELLIAWANQGPPMAYVERIICRDEPESNESKTGFEMRPSVRGRAC